MAITETMMFLIGIFVGVAVGIYLVARKITPKNIPKNVLNKLRKKEVQENGKEKNSQEEISEDDGGIGRGRRRFIGFGRRRDRGRTGGGRGDKGGDTKGEESRGFTDKEGISLGSRTGDLVTEEPDINPRPTETIEERRDLPIQPIVESDRTETSNTKAKRNPKKDWPSFN